MGVEVAPNSWGHGVGTVFVRQQTAPDGMWRSGTSSAFRRTGPAGFEERTAGAQTAEPRRRPRAHLVPGPRAGPCAPIATAGPTSWAEADGVWRHRSGAAPYEEYLAEQRRKLPKVLCARIGSSPSVPRQATKAGHFNTPKSPRLGIPKPGEELDRRIRSVQDIFSQSAPCLQQLVRSTSSPSPRLPPRLEELSRPKRRNLPWTALGVRTLETLAPPPLLGPDGEPLRRPKRRQPRIPVMPSKWVERLEAASEVADGRKVDGQVTCKAPVKVAKAAPADVGKEKPPAVSAVPAAAVPPQSPLAKAEEPPAAASSQPPSAAAADASRHGQDRPPAEGESSQAPDAASQAEAHQAAEAPAAEEASPPITPDAAAIEEASPPITPDAAAIEESAEVPAAVQAAGDAPESPKAAEEKVGDEQDEREGEFEPDAAEEPCAAEEQQGAEEELGTAGDSEAPTSPAAAHSEAPLSPLAADSEAAASPTAAGTAAEASKEDAGFEEEDADEREETKDFEEDDGFEQDDDAEKSGVLGASLSQAEKREPADETNEFESDDEDGKAVEASAAADKPGDGKDADDDYDEFEED